MTDCLICGSAAEPILSFGRMPIANGFLTADQVAQEYFFDLGVAFCPGCHMVQLAELVDREKLFHANYAFFSSTSAGMKVHFKQFADEVAERYLEGDDPFVVEIGSNDGIMLGHFARARMRHLGIEPSANVAEVARQQGIETTCRFFDEDLARQVVAEHGQADALLGANVFCHIPYLHSVAEGAKLLLKPRGVLIFEDPYLGDIMEKTSYDQIYDEHAFYFSVDSVSYLFAQHGLEVVDVEPQDVHGGSMRYVVCHKGARPCAERVATQCAKERALGLHRRESYERLRHDIQRSRDELVSLLHDVKRRGHRIVGYGATSKSTTVINYCGITSELLEYISDTTPTKQGKLSPGAHIPIRAYEDFRRHYPDYALLFAWNHQAEILPKERAFALAGGKWISYVPTVRVLA